MHTFIVCTSKNIQKEGGVLDRTATFRGVLLGKRGVTFFWGGGGVQLSQKNKLKSETFNDKKKL